MWRGAERCEIDAVVDLHHIARTEGNAFVLHKARDRHRSIHQPEVGLPPEAGDLAADALGMHGIDQPEARHQQAREHAPHAAAIIMGVDDVNAMPAND